MYEALKLLVWLLAPMYVEVTIQNVLTTVGLIGLGVFELHQWRKTR